MKVTTIEMRGLLTGKCVPRDMKVNEDLAQYFVRKFEYNTAEVARLNKQIQAQAPDWQLVSDSGNPSIPVGERAEFWVCHVSENGQHYLAKLTWFNHVEPHEDDHDAIDNCEMSTPDGENFWPVGWHEEFSSHDFEHFYEPSRLKVVAYAPFVAPKLPVNLSAGEVPNV